MDNALYNTAILTLAAGIPHLGTLEAPHGHAEKTARLCGSRVAVDLCLDEAGRVCDFAQTVKACALGQAAAAILGQNVMGASVDELVKARDAYRAMIKDGAAPPAGRFAGLASLASVHDYPQRHESALLPFETVAEAAQAAAAAKAAL